MHGPLSREMNAVVFTSAHGQVTLLNGREMNELSRHGWKVREDFISFIQDTSHSVTIDGHTYYGSEAAIERLCRILSEG
jgi:hypothetical protein